MTMECEAIRDDIDAWALGVLDHDDAQAVDSHLSGCDACSGLADEARETAAAIGLAVPLVASGSALKARVMASAAVLREMPMQRTARRRWWIASAAAIVIAAASAGGIWAASMQSKVSDLKDRNASIRAGATSQSNQFATVHTQLVQASASSRDLASSQDAVLDIVSQGDIRRMPLNGTAAAPASSGRYIWSDTSELGALVVAHMPPLDAGHSYCMWIVYENAWVAGGLFDVDSEGSGRLVVRDRDSGGGDHGRFVGFAVTVEPSTGAIQHTGPTVMQSPLD